MIEKERKQREQVSILFSFYISMQNVFIPFKLKSSDLFLSDVHVESGADEEI